MIKVYSDGSCDDNENGGFAVVINREGIEHTITGGKSNTTSTQMELHAVIQAIEFLNSKHKEEKAIIMVDYLAIEQNLKENNINNIRITSEKDRPLWEKLFRIKNDNIKFKWVKSHANDQDNIRVDKLAKIARKRYEFSNKKKNFIYYTHQLKEIKNNPLFVEQTAFYMIVNQDNKTIKKGKINLGETYKEKDLLEIKLFSHVIKEVSSNSYEDTKNIFFSNLKKIPITIRNINKGKFDFKSDKYENYWNNINEYLSKFDIDVYTNSHQQFNFFNITLPEHQNNQKELQNMLLDEPKIKIKKYRI